MNAIETHHLSKNYRVYLKPFDRLKEAFLRKPCHDLVEALTDISFDLPEGGTLGIIGENGAGKSTLLKILAGTARPSSGRMVKRGRLAALLELGSGFHPEFSGRQNIYLNAALLGLQEKEIRDREQAIIAFSELENAIDRPVKTYSSGMYMRLAFSIATSVEPDVLIIDEALSVGDHRFQQKCVDRMIQFRDLNKTIIICTHSMYLVNELCTRAIWLSAGKLRGIGKASTIISEYMASLEKNSQISELPREAKPPPKADGPLPEITIKNIQLLDEEGAPFEQFRQFDSVVIRVQTRRKGPPLKGHMSVGIFHSGGKRIFETTTKLTAGSSILFHGEQVTELLLPQMQIAGGKYFVQVRVGDEHALRVIDEFKSPPFVIESRNPEMGMVWLEHTWAIPRERETDALSINHTRHCG